MSRNGSGVYSLPPGSVIANGQTSDATDLNTPLADIASDLNVARPVVAGGTGAANASDARDNLGVTTALAGKQDADDTLTSIAALGTAADKLAYTTDVNTWAEADITAEARTLLAAATKAAQRGAMEVPADSADTDLANDPDAALRRDIGKAYVDDKTALPAYGAVGSHVLGFVQGTTIIAGNNYSGASIRPGGMMDASRTSLADDSRSDGNDSALAVGSGTLSGTWRALGSVTESPSLTRLRVTLFVRIS